MAGYFRTIDGPGWSIRSSVFYWIMDTMAEHSLSAELSARLREISEFNLGLINLAELSPAELDEFTSLAQRAPQIARDELPDTPHRDAFVSHIVDFAEAMASDRRSPPSGES
jgi:hypothetical protein